MMDERMYSMDGSIEQRDQQQCTLASIPHSTTQPISTAFHSCQVAYTNIVSRTNVLFLFYSSM